MIQSTSRPRQALAVVLAALITLPQAGLAQAPAKSAPGKPTAVSISDQKVELLFVQNSTGIEYDKDGIQRVREAAKEGTIVLLPSHKSHIDYLILSYIFNAENLPLPLIAAGDNLDFFPVGAILRRGGASLACRLQV